MRSNIRLKRSRSRPYLNTSQSDLSVHTVVCSVGRSANRVYSKDSKGSHRTSLLFTVSASSLCNKTQRAEIVCIEMQSAVNLILLNMSFSLLTQGDCQNCMAHLTAGQDPQRSHLAAFAKIKNEMFTIRAPVLRLCRWDEEIIFFVQPFVMTRVLS